MAGLDLRYGDCLDLLRDIPAASVDCVLTDPPYASGGISLRERQQRTQAKYKMDKTKKIYPDFFRGRERPAWMAGLGAALAGPVLACGQGRRAAADLFGLASAADHDGCHSGRGLVLAGDYSMG